MKNNIKYVTKLYNKKPLFAASVVFFCAFVIFSISYIYDTGDTVIDDHFFHFKYASLVYSHGWDAIENFDWIYLNDISSETNRYQVGLYNIFLIPFTLITDKMLGIKVMDAFFASAFFAIIYYVMRKMHIKKSIFFLLFICITSFFLTRLLTGRAYVLAIALVFLEMYFAVEKKYKLLFLITIFHVMWHQSTFFMPLIIMLIAEAARYLSYYKIFYKNIVSSIIGICVGMMIYSGFPMNIFYLIKNILSVQSNSMTPGSSVGVEAYSKDFMTSFVLNFEVFFLFALLAGVIIVYYYISIRNNHIKRESFKNNQLVFLYAFFMLLIVTISGTLIASGRFFDYYIPTSVILFALVGTIIFERREIIMQDFLKKIIYKTSYTFIIILCVGSFLYMKKTIAKFDNSKFSEVAQWIENKSEEKDKVYLDNWSYFTPLFFYDDKNVYSTGLEPNDAAQANPDLYWKWQNFRKNLFYCDKKNNCKDDAKEFFDKINKLEEDKKQEQYKINSMKIIKSIENDFDAKFIVSDNKSFDNILHYNEEMFEDIFQFRDEDGNILIEAFQLKKGYE